MKEKILSQIIRLVREAQEFALKIGIPNILQPGLVKEMIITQILGHQLIISKRDADACDKNNPLTVKVIYEIEPKVLLKEAERQLDRSSNIISHVGFSEDWVRRNGKVVYVDKSAGELI